MTHVNSQSFFLVRAPTSVAISRRRLRELISTWHVRQDDDSDMAMTTVVSELVTNAVSHGVGDMLKVVVRADVGQGRLTIEVHDDSPALPRRRTPCPTPKVVEAWCSSSTWRSPTGPRTPHGASGSGLSWPCPRDGRPVGTR
ncbi:ATP-binding protein [Streptomyces microflavus]|uniref:ATP-binding protein n=1 Tax=Streptomyces microflavus TaxID=1919 RepID=UPI003018DD35